MYKITKKRKLALGLSQYEIYAPMVARKAQAGQFVILRVHDRGERIPLTIADFDPDQGTVTCVFQEVGKTTKELGKLEEGDCVRDFVGPLGVPSRIEKYGRIVCVGGGVGIAPIYPISRALKEAGNEVITIIGARTRDLLFWEDKMRMISDEVRVTTDDGSHMRKGYVTDILTEVIEEKKDLALCVTIGPLLMMQAVSNLTKKYKIKTRVSLNTVMVDGTGMCGCCRVTVGGETKFACVDGPEFDGHLVDFSEVVRRAAIYKPQEKLALERYSEKNTPKCSCGGIKQ